MRFNPHQGEYYWCCHSVRMDTLHFSEVRSEGTSTHGGGSQFSMSGLICFTYLFTEGRAEVALPTSTSHANSAPAGDKINETRDEGPVPIARNLLSREDTIEIVWLASILVSTNVQV